MHPCSCINTCVEGTVNVCSETVKAFIRCLASTADETGSCCIHTSTPSNTGQPITASASVFGYGNLIDDDMCMSESTVHLGTKAHRAH